MIQKKEKEIDGHSYLVHQFPARQGLSIKMALIKLIGPAISALVDNKQGISTDALYKCVSEFVAKLDEKTVPLILSLLQFTRRDGKEITELSFDQDFAGEYESLYKVLWFVIDTNSFLGKGGIGMALKRVQQTQGQPVSPPASGNESINP